MTMNAAHFPHQGMIVSPTQADYAREAELFRDDMLRARPLATKRELATLAELHIAYARVARRLSWVPRPATSEPEARRA